MRAVSQARIDAAGKIILEIDDGTQLQLPLNLLVTLSAQARRLLAGMEAIGSQSKSLRPTPIRASAAAVDMDSADDPEFVLLRLDPGSRVELPILLPDTVAWLLTDEVLDVLREKARRRQAAGRPPYHS